MDDLKQLESNVDDVTGPIHEISAQMDACKLEIENLVKSFEERTITEEDFRYRAKVIMNKADALKQHGVERSEQLHDQWLRLTSEIARHQRTGEYKSRFATHHSTRVEECDPKLFAKFYPRRYENIGQFHSPKLVAGALADMVLALSEIGIEKCGTAVNILLPALDYLIKHQMPMFFISPKLLEAVKRSDFQDEIDWTTIKIPYEHGCFVLPVGGLTHPNDGEAVCIFWSRVSPGPYPCKTAKRPFIIDIVQKSFGLVAWTMHGVYYDSNLTEDLRPTLKLHNLFYKHEGQPIPTVINGPYDDLLGPIDEQFIEDMGCIVFGTFLAMNARPTLVEPQKRLKTIKKGSNQLEFWTPNIIGKSYAAPRSNPPGSGSHNSPRMHWRRGHFRNQAFGIGRSERKVIWLEPTLIAAEK
jgi:hypothetical protein